MMASVRGVLKDGTIQPVEPVHGRNGQPVLITLLEAEGSDASVAEEPEVDWSTLTRLVQECAVETGIADLAHEHDHYLHGAPRRS